MKKINMFFILHRLIILFVCDDCFYRSKVFQLKSDSTTIMFHWILLILILQGVRGEVESCSSESPLDLCEFNITGLQIPGNVTELLKFCKQMRSYYTCFADHEKEFQSFQFCGYPLLLKSAESVISSLCKKGSTLNDGYIQNAACFKKLTQYWETFFTIQSLVGDRMANLYQKVSKDKFANRLQECIKEYQVFRALKRFVSNHCGFEGMLVFQTLYIESEYYRLHCTPLEYEKVRSVFSEVMQAAMEEKISYEDLIIKDNDISPEIIKKYDAIDSGENF